MNYKNNKKYYINQIIENNNDENINDENIKIYLK